MTDNEDDVDDNGDDGDKDNKDNNDDNDINAAADNLSDGYSTPESLAESDCVLGRL